MQLGERGRRHPGWWLAIMLIAGGWLTMRWACRPASTVPEEPTGYPILLRRYSSRANLPEDFVDKVVLAESSGRAWVVSKANAKGLMQIMPDAETDVLKKLKRSERGDLFDPEYNLLIGTTYLRMLADRFGGDAYLVLGAYHMGPTRVARFLAANPGISGKDLIQRFAGEETKKYCAKILQGKTLQLTVTRRRPRPITQSVF